MILAIIVIMIISCGMREKSNLNIALHEQLKEQIVRITPKLIWCDGLAAGARNNNIDNRPNCDVGDGIAHNGFLLAVGDFENEAEIFNAIASSFNDNNQPFRAPNYVNKDNKNEYSRDQLLGLILATIAGLDINAGLKRALDYYHRTKSLCPNPTDLRCYITPNMHILIKQIQDQEVSKWELFVDDGILLIESASAAEGYPLNLIAKQLYVKYITNNISLSNIKSAEIIAERMPNNLWIQTIKLITSNANTNEYNIIKKELLNCMASWNMPGTNFAWDATEKCENSKAWGHELIALANLLIKK